VALEAGRGLGLFKGIDASARNRINTGNMVRIVERPAELLKG